MKHLRNTLNEALVIVATILFLLLSLPLIAVLVLLSRTVLVVAGAAVLVGCLMVYCTSPRVRHRAHAVLELPAPSLAG